MVNIYKIRAKSRKNCKKNAFFVRNDKISTCYDIMHPKSGRVRGFIMSRYKYNCCMIYQNYPGNPAMEEIKKIRQRKESRKIYPETKKEIGETPEQVITKSRKYAIFIGSEYDVIANAFKTDIEHAAESVSDFGNKRILYTIINGSRDDDNVQKVENIFEKYKVPVKRTQFVKYRPERVENYINNTSIRGRLKALASLIIIIAMTVLAVAYFYNRVDFLYAMLGVGAEIWEWLEILVSSVIFHIPQIGEEITESSINCITAIITVMPVTIIWVSLVHREHVSSDPLFWVWIRRFLLLVGLLLVTLVYEGAVFIGSSKADDIASSVPTFYFERKVVTDIIGVEEDIYVLVNDVLAPQGDIRIEKNGIEIYSSAEIIKDNQDNTFNVHMQLCPELNEGAEYILAWNLDLVEQDKQSFTYHSGEPIVVYMEPAPMWKEVYAVTKDKLLKMASDAGISYSDRINICVQNDDISIPIDISMADTTDILFRVDIGMIYLILKDDIHEKTVSFTTNGSLQYQIREDVEISEGNFAVVIEFKK